MGGPTPSVPPSAGSLQKQLRLHSSPFHTIDHPQTADPVMAFGKMAEAPSTTKATAHLTKYTWSVQVHFTIPQPISQFKLKHSWCVTVGERVLVE